MLALGPPAAVVVLANLVCWLSAARHGFDFFHSGTWVRFDSLLYEDISRHGYNLFSCARIHRYTPADYCGNAGWFPGYPTLLWVGERLGLSAPATGVVVSVGFEFGLLLVLWNGFLRHGRDRAAALMALATAGFFFGQVYQRAVFPISMEIFFLLLTVWFAQRRWWVRTGLAGAAAAFTYSTGFLLIAALGLWILLEPSIGPFLGKVRAAIVACGLTLVGYLAVLTVQRIGTGTWSAFFKIQKKYGYSGLHLPTSKLAVTLRPLFAQGLGRHQVAALQTLLVAVLCVGLAGWALWQRRNLEPLDRLVLTTVLVFWLFPLSLGADVHLYRSEALLLPSVLLTRKLPRAVQAVALGGLVVLSYVMSALYFQRVLI
jgi:hypothetical protein